MSRDFIPSICGENNIYVPDRECTDCEKLEARVKDLEDTRLVQEDIIAGEHITVDYAEDSNEVTINADLSNYYTMSDVDIMIDAIQASHFEVVQSLPETGATNIIYLLENGDAYDQYIYTEDDGWVKIGTTSISLDKQTILNALGYEEIQITMTDTNGVSHTRTVLSEINQ